MNMFQRLKKVKMAPCIALAFLSVSATAETFVDVITVRQASGMYPNILLTIDDSGSMFSDYLGQGYIPLFYYLEEGTDPASVHDWRQFTTAINTLHYNPATTYEPWAGFPEADINIAFKRLLGPESFDGRQVFRFSTWQDTAGQWLRQNSTSLYTYATGADGWISYWDDYTEVVVDQNRNFIITEYKHKAENWWEGLGHSKKEKNLNWNQFFKRSYQEELQNIANWERYHRFKYDAVKNVISRLIDKYPNFYYGLDFLNGWDKFKPVRAVDEARGPHNEAILNTVYGFMPSGLTPLHQAMVRAGDYFKNGIQVGNTFHESPVKQSCQVNLSFQLTDGYSTDTAPRAFGDVDGDGTADTMADIARYYFVNDIAPDLQNVATRYVPRCPSIPSVSHQTVNFVPISFGVQGTLVPDADKCWPTQKLGVNDFWSSHSPDILWHAAYNSRGIYDFSATPDELFTNLDAMFQQIENELLFNNNTAFSSNSITLNSVIYFSQADLQNKTGDLVAKKVFNDNGYVGFTELWVASEMMPQGNLRKIISFNTDTNAGVKINSNDQGQGLSQQHSNRLGQVKATFGSQLHNTPLGAILHSDITYVGGSIYLKQDASQIPQGIPGNDTYLAYVNSRKSAKPVVYVGGFDNMLHAFDGETGKELFAYVPSDLIKENMFNVNIPQPRFGVDGKHYVSDVYLPDRGGWRTVLIGGLRRGGQGYYALDITDPFNFTEKDVLWELTDADTAEIGVTFARPSIGVFENGKSYAVLANGYNNSINMEFDAQQSKSGRAALFVVDLNTGAIAKTFQSRKGINEDPNGIGLVNGFAEPALVDSDKNGLIDTLYVGDWFGELYAFDVQEKQASNWSSFGGRLAGQDQPVMPGDAVDHYPITTKPVISKTQVNISGDIVESNLVIYGTGQNITGLVPVHPEYLMAMVHDRDPRTALVQKSSMIQHSISFRDNALVYQGRSLQGTVDSAVPASNNQGWYIKFDGPLENYVVARDMSLISGELHVVLDPKPSAVLEGCVQEERGLLNLVLNPRTGGPTANTVFIDNEGKRLESDGKKVVGEMISKAESALQLVLDVNGDAWVMYVEDGEVKFKKRGNLNAGDGRQSWRRLY